MITPKQIRAARAFAGWDTEDLAKRVGLTRRSITNIENGTFSPRKDTVRKIVQVFADNGVEFDSDYGVRAKQENYRVLEGEDCFLRLLDEVYYSTHQRGLEVLFICVDDAVSTPEVVAANKRILDGGAPCRYLASVNAKRFDYDLKNYRLIPEKHYKNSLMVIYGDKVATLRGTNDAVLIIKDKEQAEMLRGLFEIIWAQSPAPQKRAKA